MPLFYYPPIAGNLMKKTREKNVAAPESAEIMAAFARLKRPMRMDALLRVFSLSRVARKALEARLAELEKNGELIALPGGTWAAARDLKKVVGQYLTRRDGGMIKTDDGREIFVHPSRAGDALHKDIVRAVLIPGGDARSGKITEVIKRQVNEMAARIIKREGEIVLCKPTDWHINANFTVKLSPAEPVGKKLKLGTLVSLRPETRLAPDLWSATLVNIFGAEDRIDVQEALVKCNHEAPAAFPPLALAQAEALPQKPDPADYEGREDWRDAPFVTIDGADARDFDDAVYVEREGKNWILRVAIADVSHYVRPDERKGSLDAEALRRGNSWYFPRSVEPMLPKTLSNGLCSLNPGEDRLAMMAEIEFNERGEPLKSRFAPIVMRSAGRLVYDNVAILFDDAKSEAPGIDPVLIPRLHTARELFKLLEARRRERGSLDFDLPEPVYSFTDDGQLAEMGVRERNDAHKLVEEFMIAANETVARHLAAKGKSMLYRVHPQPEETKLAAFFESLRAIAPELAPSNPEKIREITPALIRDILVNARGKPQEYVVNKLCLRAMQQARYQPENVGHFGLASKAYCHFTSPIRRYADLMVHRVLKNTLGADASPLPAAETLVEIGDKLNKLEREAMECEREMARRMGCLALAGHEGEILDATISGVTEFGAFVELDAIPAEGLMRLETMGDDWFELDQKRQCLVGQRTGRLWRLGQRLKVRVLDVNLDKLEIRLEPAKRPKSLPPRRRKPVDGRPREKGSELQKRSSARATRGAPRKKDGSDRRKKKP